MSLFPDFSNGDLFPTFSECPLKESLPSRLTTTTSPTQIQFLMGTIGENMTLGSNPTFICKDRSGASFALTLKLPREMQKEGVRGGGLDFKSYRKGWSVFVRGPVRSGVKEGKQGFVECEVGECFVIPTSMEKLAAMNNREWSKAEAKLEEGMAACQGCDEVKIRDELSRCKGCEAVWYCDKECQTKGWSERDHKVECKTLKALGSPFFDAARSILGS